MPFFCSLMVLVGASDILPCSLHALGDLGSGVRIPQHLQQTCSEKICRCFYAVASIEISGGHHDCYFSLTSVSDSVLGVDDLQALSIINVGRWWVSHRILSCTSGCLQKTHYLMAPLMLVPDICLFLCLQGLSWWRIMVLGVYFVVMCMYMYICVIKSIYM